MRYFFNIVVPMLLQLLFTWVIIEATRGGGSFVGLAAMLVAVLAVPGTAIWNFVRVRRGGEVGGAWLFLGSLGTAMVFPGVVVGLFLVQGILGAVF
ncbi:MAG: hypothetical protein ACT4P9_14000 [Betaproteobacteria bacterium]